MNNKALIVANGEFPSSKRCLDLFADASMVVCCDGAIINLEKIGVRPDVIIGDLDSISDSLKERFSDILVHCANQDTNDLTKAVNYCEQHGFHEVDIIAATGLREDHTIANISLLVDYMARGIKATIYSDFSTIFAIDSSQEISSFPNQKVSIFAIDNTTKLSSHGLAYEMNDLHLSNWWNATLNHCIGKSFTLTFEKGKPLVIITSF